MELFNQTECLANASALIHIEGYYNFANHLNLNLSGVNSFIKCLTLIETNLSEEFPCIVVSRSQNKM